MPNIRNSKWRNSFQ